MNRTINRIIAVLLGVIAFLLLIGTERSETWPWIIAVILLAVVHLCMPDKKKNRTKKETVLPGTAMTELVLLSEEGDSLATWNIYGKNGIVIGRDIGENHVTVNLNDSVYASMIDVEHAVLNYSGEHWYIEDISRKNGVSIRKNDGKKYRLAYGKPCRLERGDIIYIALTQLQII